MDGFPPTYRIYHTDSLHLSQHEPLQSFDLIYLDPPSDTVWDSEFLARLEVCVAQLSDSGFLLIHCERQEAYERKQAIDKLGLPFKGDMIWSYRQRSVKTKALQNHHDTVLVYSSNPFYHKKRLLFSHSLVGPSSYERTGFLGQKPVDLMKRLIRRLDEYHRLEMILDPFMGSGTTLVAGFELGREVVGFDISATACQITDKRLQLSLPASRQLQLELE